MTTNKPATAGKPQNTEERVMCAVCNDTESPHDTLEILGKRYCLCCVSDLAEQELQRLRAASKDEGQGVDWDVWMAEPALTELANKIAKDIQHLKAEEERAHQILILDVLKDSLTEHLSLPPSPGNETKAKLDTEERVSFTLSELTQMLRLEIGAWVRGVHPDKIAFNAQQVFKERLHQQTEEKKRGL